MTEPVVRTRLWRHGVLRSEQFPFDQISDHLSEGSDCLVWVDLCAPTHAQLEELGAELSLSALAIEDAVEHHERPKVNRYATHTFVTAYGLELDRGTGELTDRQVSAFVLKNALVTVHRSADVDIQAIVARWDDNSDLMKFGVQALLWGMLDVLVDGHFEVVEALDDEIEALEDVLFDGPSAVTQIQRRTFALRKSLVHSRRAVLPMREVLLTIMRRDTDIAGELRPYFEDLYDHVLRVTEWTESLRDLITSVFETNLSLQDARLNSIMKRLTAFTALIAVPTAVTGFYGQNVPYPGFGKQVGFFSSIAVILVLAGLLYAVFRRNDWL